MSLVIKIVLVIVALIALGAAVLRIRKLRRDEQRHRFSRVDRRLMTPPPSPYTPSKGFRLLDGELPVPARPEPSRPRLEPEHEYVFSEAQLPPLEESALAASRHDTQWALSRSGHRPMNATSGTRVGLAVVVLVLVIGSVGFYVQHHRAKASTPRVTTTSTTLRNSSTTTTTWPASFVPTSSSGNNASYSVPATSYKVTVNGVAGAVWTVYRMGPNNTLEYQGKVAQGQSQSLTLTGRSEITLGSPGNAAVSVGGSPVTFPSPVPAPLTLIFTPPTTTPG